MTQTKNKPEPKNGDLWWTLDNTYPGEGYKIEEWCSHLAKFVQPIARVLTPDEIAAKDAEIESLREALTWYADVYNYQVAGGGGVPSMVMLPPGATIVDYDRGQRARKALEGRK